MTVPSILDNLVIRPMVFFYKLLLFMLLSMSWYIVDCVLIQEAWISAWITCNAWTSQLYFRGLNHRHCHQHIIKKLLGLENGANASANPCSTSYLRQVCQKVRRIPRKADGKICQKRCANCYKKLANNQWCKKKG